MRLAFYFLPSIGINFQGVQTTCFTIMVAFSRKPPYLLILGIAYCPDSLEQKVFSLSILPAPPTLGDVCDRMAGVDIPFATVSGLKYQSLTRWKGWTPMECVYVFLDIASSGPVPRQITIMNISSILDNKSTLIVKQLQSSSWPQFPSRASPSYKYFGPRFKECLTKRDVAVSYLQSISYSVITNFCRPMSKTTNQNLWPTISWISSSPLCK